MKGTAQQRVKHRLLVFFRSRPRKPPIQFFEIAEEFLDSETGSHPNLIREWNLTQLMTMLRAHVNDTLKPEKPPPYQMFLPGFRGLDERIEVEQGRIPLGNATLRELRENLRVIKKAAMEKLKSDPVITERQKLIDDMAPYARMHRGLTVAEYCELKAAEVEKTKKAGR